MDYKVGFKPLDRDDAENALFFWKAKRLSLKRIVKHTNPDNPNFPDLVDDLADAEEEIKRFKDFLESGRIHWVQG